MQQSITKICKKCFNEKNLQAFHNEKRNIDGKMGICKDCVRERHILYRQANRDKINAYKRKWLRENWNRTYARLKKNYVADATARRHAKSLRTPKWLTKEHKKALRKFYRECPFGYQVDHIVPLRGKIVSGLHVPWNLQYLLADENRKKSNIYA